MDFLDNLINKPLSTDGIRKGFASFAEHYKDGNISVKELWQLLSHTIDSIGPWRYALSGMLEQVRAGECTIGEAFSLILDLANGKVGDYRGGLLVRAVGMRNGVPAVVAKRTPNSGKSSVLFENMASVTGIACAAFMAMAIQDGSKRSGVLSPEDWADPQRFYQALQKVGVPENDIVESVIRPELFNQHLFNNVFSFSMCDTL